MWPYGPRVIRSEGNATTYAPIRLSVDDIEEILDLLRTQVPDLTVDGQRYHPDIENWHPVADVRKSNPAELGRLTAWGTAARQPDADPPVDHGYNLDPSPDGVVFQLWGE